uniref:Replicase polyprotein 1ab n=1 Tax=Mikumi yellow baboon virus 1 TaxID=1546177 RepID=A0A089FYI3_9NIDO|nr:putative 1b protein [Mikumi yellow baboon virus 1]
MICKCEFRGYVISLGGRMVCCGCGHQRSPRPVPTEAREAFGPIVQYVDARLAMDYYGIRDKICTTAIIGILRGDSQGMLKVEAAKYIRLLSKAKGRLCDSELFHELGWHAYGIVPTAGPMINARGYISPFHVDQYWFEGATHAIVLNGRYVGVDKPEPIPDWPYCFMYFQYGNNTVQIGDKFVCWTRGVQPGTDLIPLDMADLARSIVAALPEGMVCPRSWLGDKRGSLNFQTIGESCLAFEHGDCWTQLFDDPTNEMRIALTFGYQLGTLGVQGKYISRRAQINGIKFVHDNEGHYAAWRVIKGAWLGHIGPYTDTPPEGFHLIARFSVIPYNQYSPLALFKLPGKVFFGGSGYSTAAHYHDAPLNYYDALQPGFCWLQLFPPLERRAEAQRAILAGQVNNEGVTGTYLEYRLNCQGISVVEDSFGEHFIYAAASDPTVRHISPVPLYDRAHIFVARVTTYSHPVCDSFKFGFGTRYGRKKRGGGKKSACNDEWASAVDKQEESAMVASLSFGAPKDTTPSEPTPPVNPVAGLVTKPIIHQATHHLFSYEEAPQIATYSPPPDGGCGIHCLHAIAEHHMTKQWPKIEPMVDWGYDAWADDAMMGDAICALALPAGFEGCTHQPYIIRLVESHFVVDYYPARVPSFSPHCAHRTCMSLVGATMVLEAKAGHFGNLHKLLPRYKDAKQFLIHLQGLSGAKAVCHTSKPTPRARAICAIIDTTPCKPADVSESKLISIDKIVSVAPSPAQPAKIAPVPPPRKARKVSAPTPAPPTQADQPATMEVDSPSQLDTSKQQAAEGIVAATTTSTSEQSQEAKASGSRVTWHDRLLQSSLKKATAAVADTVSRFQPQLLAYLDMRDDKRAATPSYYASAALWALALVLLSLSPVAGLCVAILAFACNPSSRTSRISGLLYPLLLFCKLLLSEQYLVCEVDSPDCHDYLHGLSLRYASSPPRFLTPGPFTASLAILRSFTYFTHVVQYAHIGLLVLDVCVLLVCLFHRGICLKCYGRCVRLAPEEIQGRCVPSTRLSRVSLVDICDTYCSPPCDIVKMATGYTGCYIGSLSCVKACSGALPVAHVDPKKVSNTTSCTFPTCASEAVKALAVLSARGTLSLGKPPRVVKVEKLPCKNPFFCYDLSLTTPVVVDLATYELFADLGVNLSHLVIGEGDFFQAMGVKRPNFYEKARLKLTRGGGRLSVDLVLTIIVVVLSICVGAYFQRASICGIGTPDPFCTNTFGVPLIAKQGVCDHGYCASPQGISASITSLFVQYDYLPYISLFLTVTLLAYWYVPQVFVIGIILLNALAPTLPFVSVLRVCAFFVLSTKIDVKLLLLTVLTTSLVDLPASLVCFILFGSAWIIGKCTGVGGLVTPYDIHLCAKTPRDSIAIANAAPNTYLGAVRMAALSGTNRFFVGSNAGIILEGLLREKTKADNTCSVFGVTAGTGGLYTRDGKVVCITASHVCGDGEAMIKLGDTSTYATFKRCGDFAEAEVNIPGCFPAYVPAQNYQGRAYWLTSTGVETGFVTNHGAVVFSGPGDSGSPIITPTGEIIGVHTGSDSKGSGAYSKSNGHLVTGPVKLSDMAAYYEGPLVPVETRLPANVSKDVESIPKTLATLLSNSIHLEGSLGTLQLLVVAMVMWKYLVEPQAMPYIAVFFILNEILPRALVRGLYNYALFCASLVPGFGPRVLFIRLVTAVVNRNCSALVFHLASAVLAVFIDFCVTGDLKSALHISGFYFVSHSVPVLTSMSVGLVCFIVVALLEAFGHRTLPNIVSGNGSFDPTFLARYFHEGIKTGVSSGIVSESLTGALATQLTTEELTFLNSLTEIKAFVSAQNLQNAVNDYIASRQARALRAQLASVHASAAADHTLATLDKFLTSTEVTLKPGDPVVLLGPASKEIIPVFSGAEEYIATPVRSQKVAGTVCTICKIISSAEGAKLTTFQDKLPYIKINGKVLADHPDYKFENDGRLPRERDDQDLNKKNRSTALGQVDVNGHTFTKYWDKTTGDVWYEPYVDEGAPTALLGIEEAAKLLGVDTHLNEKDIARLTDIIGKLKALTGKQALNLLTAAGFSSADRSGLVLALTSAKFVDEHACTRAWNGIDFKLVTPTELLRTARLSISPQPAVAHLADDTFLIMRRHPPSLIDVITKGLDAERQPVLHSPGDTGIDGYLWDFEAPHSKEAQMLTGEIVDACAARRGDAPGSYPYNMLPVRGDPYREGSKLCNTRFGDIKTTTVADTDNPWLRVLTINPRGTKAISDGKILGTTTPLGSEIYIPTLPEPVLEYLDSRPDCPTYRTQHGTEEAALKDLAKFDLSTQGFIFPQVLHIVRNYLVKHIGYHPPIYKPHDVPSNDSHAGVNGLQFSTKMIQALPDVDKLCETVIKEVWQSVTPVSLKKQYCSKAKTRTILGTSSLVSLALRATLSGVTKAFMKAGKGSPICLGKSKFEPLQQSVSGRCLETDLASCDRSTPAVVRYFTTKLLFELACSPDAEPLYVANCCHDLLSSQTTCFTKRGGLSSGDPVTSIANTVYSLILYTQHMVLSSFKLGHPISMKFLQRTLTMEDLLKVQPIVVYSDDLVLLNEPDDFASFKFWCDHLQLALGFVVDRSKTVTTDAPGFLGCTLRGSWLVPQRDRVLAALAYHMNAKDAHEYYVNAVAILSDASALSYFDREWFDDLVVGMCNAATTSGFSFPGPAYFRDFFEMVSGYKPESKVAPAPCAICMSTSCITADCGMSLCGHCAHRHIHPGCTVPSPFCKHKVGSNDCHFCSIQPLQANDELSKLLAVDEFQPKHQVEIEVINGYTNASPGRYMYHKKMLMLKKGPLGCPIDLPDGRYPLQFLPTGCAHIIGPKALNNAALSKLVVGPPGTGKTTTIKKLLTQDSVVYCPTHASMMAYSKSLPAAQFTVPAGQNPEEYGTPARYGPKLQLLSAGFVPGDVHYVDEACYANPFDLLRLLTKTPITAIGDPNQLSPVGFDKPCYVFRYMKKQQLTVVYRFGDNICKAIQKVYPDQLTAHSNHNTEIIYQKVFEPRGQVLTPYHRDRVDGAMTIDSAQGSTFPVVTLYLPSKKSLTQPRALVAITRVQSRLYIYDPHDQLSEFFTLDPYRAAEPPHAQVVDDKVVVRLAGNVMVDAATVPGLVCTARPTTDEQKALLSTSGLVIDSLESGSLSPLPRVAYNLGYYYSPDIPTFLKLPAELAKHWPVVTNKNSPEWPNRLVVSPTRISPLSQPAMSAGYYVGSSLFIGSPGIPSYWLTQFLDGKAVPMEQSIFSTGRFELDIRGYLNEEERSFALAHPHAFIGDTKGTTVGGCHHITSRYLPKEIPTGSVVKVGVSKTGVAHKSCCTLTDIYLPDLQPYTNPPTASKVYKVNVDYRPSRLMVWKDSTMYFQEGADPLALVDAVRNVRLSPTATVRYSSNLSPMNSNRKICAARTDDPVNLAVSTWDDLNCEYLVSTTDPFDIDSRYELVNATEHRKETILGGHRTLVYYYKVHKEPQPRPIDGSGTPPAYYNILRRIPCYPQKASWFNFLYTAPSCTCSVAIATGNGTRCHCAAPSNALASS